MIVVFDESEQMVRDTVRDLCTDLRGSSKLKDGAQKALWKQCADLGLLGVTLPEDVGGSAGNLIQAGAVSLELGRAGISAAYADTIALATVLQGNSSDTSAAVSDLLKSVVQGEISLSLALALDDADPLTSERRGGQALTHVSAAPRSLVIEYRDGATPELVALESQGQGRPVATVALSAGRLIDLPVKSEATGQVLLKGRAAHKAWTQAVAISRCLSCAYLVGAGRQFLELSTDYAGTRVQFGRPIGTFQAVQHALAETLGAVEAAELVTFKALAACDREVAQDHPDVRAGIAFVREAMWTVLMKSYDVLGGVGYMEDHPFSRFVRELLPVLAGLGSAQYCEEAAAGAVKKGGWL